VVDVELSDLTAERGGENTKMLLKTNITLNPAKYCGGPNISII
jgi:hypothetical protein